VPVGGVHPLDAYLLDGNPTKAAAIAAVLADRRPIERAQPFYRALEALGARVADEALIALRLTLAGRTPYDAAITTLRAHVAAARRGDAGARAAYLAAVETA
jgi:isoaspartyl peptidase/L-asparaginase-like protein (Ntn-hydrolase superfamily)